ncbi:MAG: RNA 3'-phosphate cyclase [Archaeoglobi archaeon]|jgi:RNA 3'-terminal phosphate cyclase (ATP)|nr:MAG: RNA 3'-phosphate cyclase [Archaeoglobi archaeon]TDA29570.1 MAG: RNA 3'-phosphate cyclase [Archaeoglobi archaeon]
MIKIDGSFGEGGGQILRTAVALSCITGKEVEVFNIRANRPKPGLAPQHLKGIEAAKLISNAQVEGLRLGSTRIVFKPKSVRGGDYKIDIGTAGSVTLILQTILPPLLIADKPSRLELIGGTDVAWSPSIDYFEKVTLRALRDMNCYPRLKIVARGYYPKGGGKVILEVDPEKLRGYEFLELKDKIEGVSHCQNLPEHVAIRQKESLIRFLMEKGLSAEIKVEVLSGISTGSGITVWSGYKGGSALGEKGKRAEEVGLEAARNFYAEFSTKAAFDSHLADQIMVFGAIASGRTRYTTTKITGHQKSNRYVINSFLGEILKLDESERIVEIKGTG